MSWWLSSSAIALILHNKKIKINLNVNFIVKKGPNLNCYNLNNKNSKNYFKN